MHILLTGASSGIGRELAILLDQAGHQLSLCGRNPAKLATTHSLLQRANEHFIDAFCMSDFAAIASFVTRAESQLGAVDVLINCAGLNSARAQGHELSREDFDWMLTVNCHAPIATIKAVLPAMLLRQQGTVINVLSTTCLFANAGIAGYSASKAALDSYTKVMRKELRAQGIKFLSVYPGGVNTDFREADRPQYLAAQDVALAILPLLAANSTTHIHELVIRPSCEENFC